MKKKSRLFLPFTVLLCVCLLLTPASAWAGSVSEASSEKSGEEEEKIPLKDAVVKYESLIYTGQERTQTIPLVVTAEVGGKTETLKKNRDFIVKYKDNLNAGKATMTVTGTGKYTGTLTRHFRIRPVSLVSAELRYESLPYTGRERTQSTAAVVRARVAGQERTLTYPDDFEVSYENNIEIGTATMIITGKGNYAGTIKKTFEIIPPPGG